MRTLMGNGMAFDSMRNNSNTKLLLHCNGTDESTTITDSGNTGHSPAAQGDSKLDTAIKKFGTASLLHGSTANDYVSVADHADWNFGSGNLTIDFWVYYPSLPDSTYYGFFDQYVDVSNGYSMYMVYYTTQQIIFKHNNPSIQVGGFGVLPVIIKAGEWYHIAIIRGWGGVANQWAITVNGKVYTSESKSGTMGDWATTFNIGKAGTYSSQGAQMDEFRVVKGEALWTTQFIPPAGPYS